MDDLRMKFFKQRKNNLIHIHPPLARKRRWCFYFGRICTRLSIIGVDKRGCLEAKAPPIEMPPMIKMRQKTYCFFSFSFFQHLRLQQYMCTTVIYYKIDHQGALGPLNSIFADQFKRINLVKLRFFVLKVATLGPYLIFL